MEDYYTEKRLKMLENLKMDILLDSVPIPEKLLKDLEVKKWNGMK